MTTADQSSTGTQAQAESPTARFTAVNGRDQTAAIAPMNGVNGNGASRRGSDERSNGQPRISPPGQEKLTITTTTSHREDWAPPTVDRQSFQPPRPYSDSEMSHKRKRSESIDQNSSSANSYHSHALPSSTKQTPTTATTESDGPREESLRAPTQPEVRDTYPPEASYRSYLPSTEDSRDSTAGPEPWHSRQYSQPHITSDEHLGEVLQQASRSMDAQSRHHDFEHGSPGDDDRSINPYGGYGNDRREMSAQSDPKKRKRNFSNRTKTGCMTCRRRKKKCDETRPECKLSFGRT